MIKHSKNRAKWGGVAGDKKSANSLGQTADRTISGIPGATVRQAVVPRVVIDWHPQGGNAGHNATRSAQAELGRQANALQLAGRALGDFIQN
jgi:hypothetical protein